MTKKGAPNKYETRVKPRFNEIEKWCQLGATDKEIWTNLGIAKSTFIDYKNKYSDFSDLIKNNRSKPVVEIKAAMLKRAKGFQYEEKKVTTQKIVIDGVDEEKIPAQVIKTEVMTKYALPDVAAGLVLLQHWDKDEEGKTKWSRDPASLEHKKEELEFKKEQAENNNW